MQVVRDPDGRIQPPLDAEWDMLTRLRWLAGVVLQDTGLSVQVVTGSYSEPDWRGRPHYPADVFGLQLPGGASIAALSYDATWWYLTGIGWGVELVSARGYTALDGGAAAAAPVVAGGH